MHFFLESCHLKLLINKKKGAQEFVEHEINTEKINKIPINL